MPLDDIPQLDEVDDVLDGLSSPTSLEVYEAILPYENDMVAASATRRAMAGLAATTLDQIPSPVADVSLNGHKITGLATPTAATDAATKAYADAIATGLDVKLSVKAATTANITLSGAQTIDGVSVVSTDRVLVKNQSAGAENGIYAAAAGAWARSTDADVDAEVNAGMFTFIEAGTAQTDTGWVLVTNNPITVGTTALVFTQFSGVGSGIAQTIVDAKGDLIVATAADTVTRLPVGTNGQVLSADSAQATGQKWVSLGDRYVSVLDAGYGGYVNSATDFSAVANAAQDALVAQGGGVLFWPRLPAGSSYRIAQSAMLPIKDGCHWVGEGREATRLFCQNDLGAGTYAIGPQAGHSPAYRPSITGMLIIGPGPSSYTATATPAVGISGIRLTEKMSIYDCEIQNFHKGIVVHGDHNNIHRTKATNCDHNMSFCEGWNTMGDTSVIDCDFTGARHASLHQGGDCIINHAVFQTTHFGFGPYGWLFTDFASAAGATSGAVVDCKFINCAFETCGNAAIKDMRTNAIDLASIWSTTLEAGFLWDAGSGYRIGGARDDWTVKLGWCQDVTINSGFYPFVAAAVGTFYVPQGSINVVVDCASSGSTIPIHAGMFASGIGSGGWGGTLSSVRDRNDKYRYRLCAAATTITAGDLVTSGGSFASAIRAARTTGITGVAVTSGSGAGWTCLVQEKGPSPVLSETVSGGYIELAQITGTLHKLGLASAYPANPVMAISHAAGGNAGATATVMAEVNGWPR